MHIKTKNKKILTVITALFCCALWGISTPVVKMGYAYTDPSHVPSLLLWAGIQFALAGILTIGTHSIRSKHLVYPKKKNIKFVALISLLQTVLQYALVYTGLLYTTSVKGSILKSTDVFFVALISGLLFKIEKLSIQKVLSCIIGFLGIIVMNLDGLSLNISPLGDGLVLLGIISYSFAVVFIKLFASDEDPIVLSGYQMTLGGTVMLVFGAVFNGRIDFVGMLPVILILSAIYAVSYSLWTSLLKKNSPSSITIYSFMTPVFGVLCSALLLKEQGGVAPLNLILALVLVCLGIIIWGKSSKE